MAKNKDKKTVDTNFDGLKCFQKLGGGSHRFANRIIKTGQKFWIAPDAIPASMKDLFKEVPADVKAVVVGTNQPVSFAAKQEVNVAEKFEMVPAVDENGEQLKKGNSPLYNIIDEGGKSINDKPLRKGKATELLETLSV